jgi:hypothetical protein
VKMVRTTARSHCPTSDGRDVLIDGTPRKAPAHISRCARLPAIDRKGGKVSAGPSAARRNPSEHLKQLPSDPAKSTIRKRAAARTG